MQRKALRECRSLLREFFGNNVLLERETDIQYVKIANYVFNELMKPNGNYRITFPNKIENSHVATIDLFFYRGDQKKTYEDYLTATGDTKILNTFDKFSTAFKKLLIYVYDRSFTLVGGTMGHEGTMSMYVNVPSLDPGDITTSSKLLISALKPMKSIFVHEFTHYLNSARSGFKAYRSKGGDDQFNVFSSAYAKSTEELQAYLIQVFDVVREGLNEGAFSKLVYAVKKDDFDLFLNTFLTLTIFAAGGFWFNRTVDAGNLLPGGVSYTGKFDDQGKRIVKRIYEFFEQLKEEGVAANVPDYIDSSFDTKLKELAGSFIDSLDKNEMSIVSGIFNVIFNYAGIRPKKEKMTGLKGL